MSKLDRTVHIATGAATIALGTIQHLDAAPATGFASTSAGQMSCDDGTNDGETNDDSATAADGETNDDTSTDADPTKPMAVPEHNAPDDVTGCNEGGTETAD